MTAFFADDGTEAVLRVMDREPWRSFGVDLTRRESDVQHLLENTPVPAPKSIALDDGTHCGSPAHLMTLLPGAIDPRRFDERSIRQLAALLADIHDVPPPPTLRAYQSWAWEAKYVVPTWASDPTLWETAFAILRTTPPPFSPTLIQRDFQMRNVLWEDDRISGVVDWVETSTGPAWLDVAHCCSYLTMEPDGAEAAAAFTTAYRALTGRESQPYFDVMDIVAFLPAPNRPALVTDTVRLRRLEQRLTTVLA
jgi:aminoglycoside phosphotransferase (APT) family kinase protein